MKMQAESLPRKPRPAPRHRPMTPDSLHSLLARDEWDWRAGRHCTSDPKCVIHSKAYMEEIDYTVSGASTVTRWYVKPLRLHARGTNLPITGSAGTGKELLAYALGHEACKRGSTLYSKAAKPRNPKGGKKSETA